MIWTKEIFVTGSQCGLKTELSMLSTFALVEDAVSGLMGELEVDGITAKEKYNAIWLYTKNRIKFFKSAKWNERIKIQCYISKITPIRLNFDTIITNKLGETICQSKVELCGIDFETRRIRKVETIGIKQEFAEPNLALEINFDIDKAEGETNEFQTKVETSNIDYLHHTNNVEYVRFLLNTYSVKQLDENEIKSIEVNYIGQSFEGETLTVQKTKLKNKDVFHVTRSADKIISAEIDF
ncbi:MAG: acyl-ACP thioesterase [Clostridia bacterium]|nr:acyl-ACP thioesterase [Clostridia bacterium]